ncbi:MAG: hypothetical protein NTX08_06815 [Sphingobacteriales bacterium]|nr:hypothetical protein [Sphingobacteriales bacterium]
MHKIWITFILLFICLSGFSQTPQYTEKEYARSPHWIQMMDIEGVNFNETLKAYAVYWQHHTMPEEEGDRYTGKTDQSVKKISKKELKERWAGADMRFQIKKFMHWKIMNETFVKENGCIMTAEERIKFHQQHQ